MDAITVKIGNMELNDILNTDNICNYSTTADIGSYLEFGKCICKCIELELNNTDGRFSESSFRTDKVELIKNNTKKGIFYIDSITKKNGKIKVQAFDKFIRTEKTFNIVYAPLTLENLIKETLDQCGIGYNLPTQFTNKNYVIHNLEELKNKTCRQVLEYALNLTGKNGELNNEEIFELVDFSEKITEINIEEAKSFIINDEDFEIVNNVMYKRSDMEFYNTNLTTTNKHITLTPNNPLLKICSTNKVQSIINNISVDMKYIPCEIEVITPTEYKIGDYLKLSYKDIDYFFYATQITEKNNNYKKIKCVGVQNEENIAEHISGDVSTSNVEFFNTEKLFKINLQDCSNNTKVFYSINFITNNSGYFNILVNGKFNRQFLYNKGNNNLSSILNYEFKDAVNTIEISKLDFEDIENYSLSILYKNALIVDEIDESDFPLNQDIKIEEENKELRKLDICNLFGLMNLKKGTKLAVSNQFFNQVVQSKVGTEELIVKGTKCNIFIKYNEENIELIFEGKLNNRITITSEEMGEKIRNIYWNDYTDYFIIQTPMTIGIVKEYKEPLNDAFERINFFRLINDECIEYENYVLRNILDYNPVDRAWNLIMTNSEPIPDIEEDCKLFRDIHNFSHLTHTHNGEMHSRVEVINIQTEVKLFINNDITSLATVYKELDGITYYSVDMGRGFYAYPYCFPNFKEYEEKYNTKFPSMCLYAELTIEEAKLNKTLT